MGVRGRESEGSSGWEAVTAGDIITTSWLYKDCMGYYCLTFKETSVEVVYVDSQITSTSFYPLKSFPKSNVS